MNHESVDLLTKYHEPVRSDGHEDGKPCDDEECQECCEHDDEIDHFICITCGKEMV